MPATWEVMSTPCEEISVPIEGNCSTHFSVRAASDVTVAGGGTWDDRIVLIMLGLKEKLNHASPPRRRTATRPVMMKRLVIGVLGGCGAVVRIAADVEPTYIAYQWLSQLAKVRVAALHRHLVGMRCIYGAALTPSK